MGFEYLILTMSCRLSAAEEKKKISSGIVLYFFWSRPWSNPTFRSKVISLNNVCLVFAYLANFYAF